MSLIKLASTSCKRNEAVAGMHSCLSLVENLKSLPPKKKLLAKSKIMTVLFEICDDQVIYILWNILYSFLNFCMPLNPSINLEWKKILGKATVEELHIIELLLY